MHAPPHARTAHTCLGTRPPTPLYLSASVGWTTPNSCSMSTLYFGDMCAQQTQDVVAPPPGMRGTHAWGTHHKNPYQVQFESPARSHRSSGKAGGSAIPPSPPLSSGAWRAPLLHGQHPVQGLVAKPPNYNPSAPKGCSPRSTNPDQTRAYELEAARHRAHGALHVVENCC